MINAVGGIQRLSVAVMVDGTYNQVPNADGQTESIYQPRPQEELDRLASVVRTTLGLNTERNDQIEIVNMPFDRNDLVADRQALDTMYQRDFYVDIAKKVLLVMLGILVLFYLKRKAGKLFRSLATIAPPRHTVLQTARTMAQQQIEEQEEVQPIVAEKRRPTLVDQMQKTAKEQPEEMARVIRTIMSE